MSNNMGFVIAGWGVVLSVLGLYSASLIVRGRRLARQIPPERRRWTS